MATSKPRITVTLDADDYAILRELSELNGESMSSIVAGLVSSTTPVLTRVITAGRAFQRAQEGLRPDARAIIEEADAKIAPAVEELMSEVLSAFAAVDAALDPRPVTRGSTPLPPTPKSQQSRASAKRAS